jgi:hypothetical protein
MAKYTDNTPGGNGRAGTAGPLAKLKRGKTVEEIDTGGTPAEPKKIRANKGTGEPAKMPKANKK